MRRWRSSYRWSCCWFSGTSIGISACSAMSGSCRPLILPDLRIIYSSCFSILRIFTPICHARSSGNLRVEVVRQLREPRWPSGKVGHQYAPPDTPECGFTGDANCKANSYTSIYVAAFAASAVVAAAVAALGVWLNRRSKFEAELLNMRWKLHVEEIRFVSGDSGSLGGLVSTHEKGARRK
ncbi:uncharacterized protein [Ptychodera flava]|uniref:uncharacterized protein n=1 Tax=Ptychodera flava TaxID=63121 RepID=UPI003969D44E